MPNVLIDPKITTITVAGAIINNRIGSSRSSFGFSKVQKPKLSPTTIKLIKAVWHPAANILTGQRGNREGQAKAAAGTADNPIKPVANHPDMLLSAVIGPNQTAKNRRLNRYPMTPEKRT
ncbi:hypothetical protein GCM10007853_00840 [Algimonas ampicilliniresistens]|uniref:Uncharacterized protein n=1 Tax=Algimonas ampicilliniresistens TaxID=1298735 RepID=A0ABQ5V543_9PROT|nr:hypothetical protein [Algimonas ampicilliniresistens]GLQ22210.1 hypothetical protein GCM10007853_00840 [Algimonas ampicilliniresistens]